MTWQMVSSQKIKKLPTSPPKWWYELSANQKYEYFKKAHDISVDQNQQLKDKIKEDKESIKNEEETLEIIRQNKEFLKKYTPFYPKFAFDLGVDVTLLEYWKVATAAKIGFYKFFLKGRFFLNPEMKFQFYDEVGVGIGLGVGFVF